MTRRKAHHLRRHVKWSSATAVRRIAVEDVHPAQPEIYKTQMPLPRQQYILNFQIPGKKDYHRNHSEFSDP